MLKKFLITFSAIFAVSASAQLYQPIYQSNPKLEFDKVISGVTTAIITIDDAVENYVLKNPGTIEASAIYALTLYLEELGVETIKFSSVKLNTPSLCDIIYVTPNWNHSNGIYKDIQLTFVTCHYDVFTFSTDQSVSSMYLGSMSGLFKSIYTGLYNRKNVYYSSNNRLNLPSIHETEFNELSIREYIDSNRTIEHIGIYEVIQRSEIMPKIKVGVVRILGQYEIIYLSGASNYNDWKVGEFKGKLLPTSVPSFFKVAWVNADKSINEDGYIKFEEDGMIFKVGENIDAFIKLYPTNSNSTISSGTGFALSPDGIIATNYHVISESKQIMIRGVNGDFNRSWNAKVLLVDKNNDLALLKIYDEDFNGIGSVPYSIALSSAEVGDKVNVLGYPLRATMGDEIKLSTGLISAKSGFQGDITCYQLSAPVYPGNSGGPVITDDGRLIGVISARHTEAFSASYAIKVSYLLQLMNNISPSLIKPAGNSLSGKTLIEQVKLVKKFVYIIEASK